MRDQKYSKNVNDMELFPPSSAMNPIDLIFRSGMSRANDFRGAANASVPIGVVAGELTTAQLLMAIPRYLDGGGKVFVDSGAFTAFRTGVEMDWMDIVRRYGYLSGNTNAPGNLYLVAPDKVGDQNKTLRLIAQWRTELMSLMRDGANLIVPIQTGTLPGQKMLELVTEILESNRWIAGIPSNRAAMTTEKCATLSHSNFHVLGRVQMNDEQEARIEALRRLNPDAVISADANWLRSRMGQISSLAGKERERKMVTLPSPKCQRLKDSNMPSFLQQSEHPRTTAIAKLIARDNWGCGAA
jgi:hypothetical protein